MAVLLTTNGHVSEEQPARDQGLLGGTWGLAHDIQIRGVEAQSGGRQTVSHQVDPQQLDGDQSLRQAQSGSQENTESEKEKQSQEKNEVSQKQRMDEYGVQVWMSVCVAQTTHQTTSPMLEEMR